MVKRGMILLIGVVFGFFAAVAMFHVTVYVDYDSGMQMEAFAIGPIVVRRRVESPKSFASLYLDNLNPGLRGVPEWHCAMRFAGNSQISAYYEGSMVLGDLTRLNSNVSLLPVSNSIAIKRRYLGAIARRDFGLANKIVNDADAEVDRILEVDQSPRR